MQITYLIFVCLDWFAIDLIIVQIILVPDSLSPLTLLFLLPECLASIWPQSWLGVILQYGGRAQFFNSLNSPFYEMATCAPFLIITFHNMAAIFKYNPSLKFSILQHGCYSALFKYIITSKPTIFKL